MIKILSIDWDYFIAVTNDFRNTAFPKVYDDIITSEQRLKHWEEYYVRYGSIKVGIRSEDFESVIRIIDNNRKMSDEIKTYVYDSHRHIYTIIKQEIALRGEEQFAIYNIDHHHDMYSYRKPGEIVNCGNWANILQEEYRDGCNYIWIKRKDSEEKNLSGRVECRKGTIRELMKDSFNIIFLCRSGYWTPPHLDGKFNELAGHLGCAKQI